MTEQAKRFSELYQKLNRDTVSEPLLGSVYHPAIEFSDPFHSIQGLEQLTRYFAELYLNVSHIHFEFGAIYENGDSSMHRWQMTFVHPRIAAGKPVTVRGCSELHWQDGLIIRHEDFFDAGAMLYQHLPLLGWLIRQVRRRMQ